MTTTEDRYILASDLPGVAEAWGVWVGCCAEEPCHCDAQTLPEELDVTIPADAAFLCLTWGPRVDRRWGIYAEHPVLHLSPIYRATFNAVLLKRRSAFETREEAGEDMRLAVCAHWLSLLNNPAALAAECRAVMEDKTND